MFRESKATAMAAFFLERAPGRKLVDLALMKLMVISERKYIAQTTSLISGARFVSMQNGPVLSEVLALMRNPEPDGLWHQHIAFVPYEGPGTPSNHCVLRHRLDASEYLSEFEMGLLTSVWAEHGRKSKWKLVELTHAFPEWDQTCEVTKSSSPIPLEAILQLGFNETPADAKRRAQTIEYFEQVAG